MNKFLIFSILIGIVLILFALLMPIVEFKAWYSWWSQYDPNKLYNSFSLTDIAYFKSNALIYRITSSFRPGPSQFRYDFWFYLITGLMDGAALGITDGGYVTPKSLCESIIPDEDPQEKLIVATNGSYYTWPNNENDWKTVIKDWGNITFSGSGDDDQVYTVDESKWLNNPDNFFNRWGIPGDSPMIIGFVTNWDMYMYSKTYSFILKPLLGMGKEGVGGLGWWGFLQDGDDFGGMGLTEIQRIVWSSDVPTEISGGINGNKKCNISGALSGSMGGAGIGAMVGPAVGKMLVPAAADAVVEGVAVAAGPETFGLSLLIGALIGGLGAGLASAGTSGCL